SGSARAPPCWRSASSATARTARWWRMPSAGIAATATSMSARSGADMQPLRTRYRDLLVGIIDDLIGQQSAALDAARDALAEALGADRMRYVAGSGHSHMLAEEVFYRAGGIAQAQAILDPDLMLHMGAERSTQLQREEGRAERVLAGYPVGPGDVVVVAS